MGEPTPDDLRLATEEARREIDHSRAVLTHADTKASLLAAMSSFAIAALLMSVAAVGLVVSS